MSDLSQEGKAVGIFYSVTKEQCFNVVKHLVDFQVGVRVTVLIVFKFEDIRRMSTRVGMAQQVQN